MHRHKHRGYISRLYQIIKSDIICSDRQAEKIRETNGSVGDHTSYHVLWRLAQGPQQLGGIINAEELV